jgi:hypothetical protein
MPSKVGYLRIKERQWGQEVVFHSRLMAMSDPIAEIIGNYAGLREVFTGKKLGGEPRGCSSRLDSGPAVYELSKPPNTA